MLACILSVLMIFCSASTPSDIAMRHIEVKSAEYVVIDNATYVAITTITLPRSAIDTLKAQILAEVESEYGETYVCIDHNAVYLISRINRGLDQDASHYQTIKKIFALRQ